MAHVMKYTKAACGHMFAHFDRKAEHISNENLDRTRTHLNYNLAARQQRMEQGEFVRKRCSEVRCQNRKDVNVMVSWVITAPKDLPLSELDSFFRATYNFCANRYGNENVVSAYVHFDEVTPHLHFAFVPVVEDKKRGGYKVSAKEAVNRSDLQRFHGDLQRHVEEELGHSVGILNEATVEGNKSIEELKRETAQKELQRTKNLCEKQMADLNIAAAAAKMWVQELKPPTSSRIFKEDVVKIPVSQYDLLKKYAENNLQSTSETFLAVNSLVPLLDKAKRLEEAARDKYEAVRIEGIRQSELSGKYYSLKDKYENLVNENFALEQEFGKSKKRIRNIEAEKERFESLYQSTEKELSALKDELSSSKKEAGEAKEKLSIIREVVRSLPKSEMEKFRAEYKKVKDDRAAAADRLLQEHIEPSHYGTIDISGESKPGRLIDLSGKNFAERMAAAKKEADERNLSRTAPKKDRGGWER